MINEIQEVKTLIQNLDSSELVLLIRILAERLRITAFREAEKLIKIASDPELINKLKEKNEK